MLMSLVLQFGSFLSQHHPDTNPETRQTVPGRQSQSLWGFARSESGPGWVWGSSNPKRDESLLISESSPIIPRGLRGDTGSKMRWKRPILSTTQASCWGTNSTTVFMGRLDAHRCWAGVTHNLGAVLWVCCTVVTIKESECRTNEVHCKKNWRKSQNVAKRPDQCLIDGLITSDLINTS